MSIWFNEPGLLLDPLYWADTVDSSNLMKSLNADVVYQGRREDFDIEDMISDTQDPVEFNYTEMSFGLSDSYVEELDPDEAAEKWADIRDETLSHTPLDRPPVAEPGQGGELIVYELGNELRYDVRGRTMNIAFEFSGKFGDDVKENEISEICRQYNIPEE